MEKTIILFALFISSLFPQVKPVVNDFLISGSDNIPSTFQQQGPRIYTANSENFVVSWTDYRKGNAAIYAQEYDKFGKKIKNNFNAGANTGIYLNKNNYLLTLNTEYSSFFDDTYFQIISKLFNETNTNLVSGSIYNGILPWCGTGYIQGEGIVSAADSSFYFLSNFGGSPALTNITDEGTIRHFQLKNLNYITQITASATSQGNYFYAYIYGKNYDTLKAGLYTTFINKDDSIIVKDSLLSELFDSTGIWDYIGNYSLNSVSLNDSTYKLFWLNNASLKLYSANMNTGGEVVSDIDSIQINKPSQTGINFSDVILTNKQEDGFYLIVEWNDFSDPPVYLHSFIKYDLNGEKTGNIIEKQNAYYINNFFYAGSDIFFAGFSDSKDVFLDKLDFTNVIERSKINDDQSGSNEINAKPLPYDSNNFFAVWSDEAKKYGIIVDKAGNLNGEKIELNGTDISFFKDNEFVSTWIKPLNDTLYGAGYSVYDHLFKEKFSREIYQSYNYYNLYIQAKVISDSTFIILAGNNNELKGLAAGKGGSILSEKIFDSAPAGIGGIRIFPENPDKYTGEIDSIWIGWNSKLQKYSSDLHPLSEIKNTPVYLPYYIGNDRFLTYTVSFGEYYSLSRTAYGTIIDSNFDTVKSHIPLAYFNTDSYNLDVGRLDNNEFLVIHENGDNKYYARAYDIDGIARKDSFRVNSNSSSPVKNLGFSVNDDKVFFSWSQIKTDGKGYDVYGNIFNLSTITAVNDRQAGLPEKFYLYQNYPNPFNPSTVIKYSLAEPAFVRITLYDILGRKIKDLISGEQNPGMHEINFNASGLHAGLSSRVYLYSLNAVSKHGNFRNTKKMLLLK